MYGYIAVVIDGPKDDYRVEFPDLPGCGCTVKSVEQGLSHAGRALREYSNAVQDKGDDLPPPRPSWEMYAEAKEHDAVAAACLEPARWCEEPDTGAPQDAPTDSGKAAA